MEDPEAHAAHAETCADCRRFAEEMRSFDSKLADLSLPSADSISSKFAQRLPVAAWEEASHRSWRVAGAALLLLAALVLLVSSLAGLSLVTEVRQVVGGWLTLAHVSAPFFRSVPKMIEQVPGSGRALIVVLFVVVNVLLVMLLRREPRGYDASAR